MRGEHSAVAAPIARDVIKAYFDKKLEQRPPLKQMQTQVKMLSEVNGEPGGAANPSAPER
jgi:hypothetical protein